MENSISSLTLFHKVFNGEKTSRVRIDSPSVDMYTIASDCSSVNVHVIVRVVRSKDILLVQK